MRVYIMRHGDAEMPYVDRQRPLSDLGRQQVEGIARLLRQRKIGIQKVYHSGILRATQTAQHIGAALGIAQIEYLNGLQPEDPVDSMVHQIGTFREDELLFVSHLPFVGKLVAQMVTGHTRHDVVLFDPSTMACLMYIGGDRWALEWVLSPSLFA